MSDYNHIPLTPTADFEVHPVGTVAALRQRAEAAERQLAEAEGYDGIAHDFEQARRRIAQQDECITQHVYGCLSDQARIAQLESALRKYGRHINCNFFHGLPCDCGYHAALRPAECPHGVPLAWVCAACHPQESGYVEPKGE